MEEKIEKSSISNSSVKKIFFSLDIPDDLEELDKNPPQNLGPDLEDAPPQRGGGRVKIRF